MDIRMLALINGWMILPPVDEFAALLRGEEACYVESDRDLEEDRDVFERFLDPAYVAMLEGKNWPIRRHEARTPAAFLEICDAYKRLAGRHEGSGVRCLFRGQYQEYLDAAGYVSVLPAALRTAVSKIYREGQSSELKNLLQPWCDVLEDLGATTQTGAYIVDESEVKEGRVRVAANSGPLVRILTNAYLLATVMHYGFPTSALDVTPTPLVALWFALHRASRDHKGHVAYDRIAPSNSGTTPTVYIYIQTDWHAHPVVELATIEELRGVTLRPFRQAASALLFRLYWLERTPRNSFWDCSENRMLWPSAVIRAHFGADELITAHPELTSDFLFPKDDPLYQRLLRAKAPGLCVFA